LTDFAFDLPGNERGPIDEVALNRVIATVQQRLDLCAVLRVRYGRELEANDGRWRTACFLPSTVSGFDGSCADQDALSEGGQVPQNLWVSEGDTTRVWRCFSCLRRGDVIDLLEVADELKRLPGQATSLSAVRVAAKLTGVAYLLDGRAPGDDDDPSELVSGAPRRVAPRKLETVDFARARAINARAAKHWHAQLKLGPGYKAREELIRRGVTSEQIDRFVLGYAANEWREVVELLPEHARHEATVLGMVGKSRQGEYFDRYRDRLMFPYCEPARGDKSEAVTGFAGRSLADDARAPKWFNSKNVEGVWKKSAALLGLMQAKQLLARTGAKRVAIGEGGWEVLAFDRIDVACLGLVAAPMTIDHAQLIAEVLGAEQVTIAADGDETGRRGALQSVISCLRYGFPVEAVTVIDPEDGSDPGKWGETREGEQRLREAWEKPLELVEFLRLRGGEGREQQKRKLVAVLPPELGAEFAEAWGVSFEQELADSDLTSSARFAEQLKREPAQAAHLCGASVRAVFADDSLALCLLRDLEFGESTRLDELTPALRRAWLQLQLPYLDAQLKAHDTASKFGEGGQHADFLAWYAHGEALRAQKTEAKKAFAKCKE